MKNLKNRFIRFTVLSSTIILTVFCASCDQEEEAFCPPIEIIRTCNESATDKLVLDGNWGGTTSQDKAISFTITNNAISSLYIGYCYTNNGRSGEAMSMATFDPPIAIGSDNYLFLSSSEITIKFTFCSNSEVSGNGFILADYNEQSYVFNAHKQ